MFTTVPGSDVAAVAEVVVLLLHGVASLAPGASGVVEYFLEL